MKVLIFGSTGYLGEQFLKLYPDAITPKIDIADPLAVAQVLDSEHPDVVINCAGKTGRPNVDWCEDHKEETIHANVIGPLVLQEACAKRSIYWVHMSSGCMYEGDNNGKGFAEDDEPNFTGSFYSRSKIWSDQILKECPNVLLLRIRMPFGDTLHPRSVITKVLKYTNVLDVQNSFTYLPDFRAAAEKLIAARKTGLYHIVNPGSVSPYDIMKQYTESVDPSHVVSAMTLEGLSDAAKTGRSNCILSTQKVEREGVTLLHVSAALRKALQAIKESKEATVESQGL